MLRNRATSCGPSRATCSGRGERCRNSSTGCARSREGECGGGGVSGTQGSRIRRDGAQGSWKVPPALTEPYLPPQTPHSSTTSLSLPGGNQGPVTSQGTLHAAPVQGGAACPLGRPGHPTCGHGAETRAGGVKEGEEGWEKDMCPFVTTPRIKAEKWHVTLRVCMHL
jgi:hypothetical protein